MNTIATVNAILRAHFDQGQSYSVIGKARGMSRNTVAGIINRNRKADHVAPRGPFGTRLGDRGTAFGGEKP
jgi:hypothetical protein